MTRVGQHLKDYVSRQLQLPEINPDACVHSLFAQANCQECVTSCPNQAWQLDENALNIDTDSCNGCGLCAPACPTGAVQIHFPWIIRLLGGQTVALFACEQSTITSNTETLPCIHAIGLRQLLLLHAAGLRFLLIASGECTECGQRPASGISQRVEQANELLHERNGLPIKILQRSSKVWQQVFKTNEVISRGTHLSRRAFLGGGREIAHHQLVVLDPLNLPASRTAPPAQLLPTSTKEILRWPWVPRLDTERCNGCDACFHLCPTDALRLQAAEADLPAGYQITPASCTGCKICADICESGAITVHSQMPAPSHSMVSLVENRCSSCGNPFHMPVYDETAKDSGRCKYCRICQEHSHNSQLFQVLEES